MLYVDCSFNINFEMIHVDAFSCSLFISLLQSVLLHAQTTAFLSILQSTDIWVIFSILWIFLYTSLNAYIEEILWGIYPQVDYCVIAYMQMKLGNVELFSKRWLYPCTLHPVNSVFEISPFHTSSPTPNIFRVLIFCQSEYCEMVSYFNLHFL